MNLGRSIAVLMLGLSAPAATAAVGPVVLTTDLEHVPLAGHIEVLLDAEPAWTLDDVRKPEIATRFVATGEKAFNFGFEVDAVWLRLPLHNSDDSETTNWVLSVSLGTLDYVDIHWVRPDGTVETTLTGDLRSSSPSLFADPRLSVPFDIAAGERAVLYVRIANAGLPAISFELRSAQTFQSASAHEAMFWGVFYGFFVLMAIYHLLIYVSVRDRVYVNYIFLLVMTAGVFALRVGHARQFGNDLWQGAPALINLAYPVALCLFSVASILFVRELLETARHAPRLNRWLTSAAILMAGLGIATPFIPYSSALRVGIPLVGLSWLLVISIGAYLAWRRIRVAYFYVSAFGINLLTYIFTLAASVYSSAPVSSSLYALAMGATFSVIVFALAIADRHNTERRERERFARLRDFFAPQVAEAILGDGGANLLEPKRREVTVVFTDLRGFTALAAQSEPEEVIKVLREYHQAVIEAAGRHGGNVEHIAGDGVMAYFNAPSAISEPEARAARMAFELRTTFEQLCTLWRARGHQLGVGIGMACGFATVGAVGAKGRMSYTCIGSVTNLAARLCGIAKHGQILVPQLFVNRVAPRVVAESLGEQELKGMPKPVAVFNLVAAAA